MKYDYLEGFDVWRVEHFPGVKEETRRFIEHLTDQNKEVKLWKHQLEATLRVIYAYEVLGKRNLLLNIVTGGGKTAIIGACVAYLKMCHQVDKFIVLVPNLIVKDRLQRDFLVVAGEKTVFQKFDFFPPEYKVMEHSLNAHVMEEGASSQGILESGVIIGNIHQVYESNTSGKKNLDWFLNKIGNFAIFNDEAHNTPADEYTKVLKILSQKTVFRLDTTATPERADGKPLDSETIMEYGISPALEDGIIKSVVVYQPDPKIIELTYSNKDTGEKRTVTELDKEFKEAESGMKPFNWIMDTEPMKKQIAISLRRFDEQKRRAKDRYKPIMFIVTMGIEEAKRVKDVLNKDFGLNDGKVLLVTEDTADLQVGHKPDGTPLTAREAATNLGRLGSSYEVVISVMMLREGWDVPPVSVILLLRRFCSKVYGQQVIGRGLRRIPESNERQILAVVDHPKLQHDWLWRLVAASGVRRVDVEDVLEDEDIPQTPKIQQLVRPELLIELPSPEYETKTDFEAILKKVPKKEVKKNWKQILEMVEYERDKWTITKTVIPQMLKLYIDKERKMEIVSGEDIDVIEGEYKKAYTIEELIELFKEQIVEMASNLLFEFGYGGLRKGDLYNVILDHIKIKLLKGKNLSEARKEDIEIVLEHLEDVRKVFSQPGIVDGILSEVQDGNK